MTTKLCLPLLSLCLLTAACQGPRATTRTPLPARPNQSSSLAQADAARVDGQRASKEAGLQDDRWVVKKKALEEAAQEAPSSARLLPTQEPAPAPEPRAASSPVSKDSTELSLNCEEMVVGKRTVPNGEVVLRKKISIEKVSQKVPLRREEFVVERLEPGRQHQDSSGAFQDFEVVIPLFREEAVAGKRSYVKEVVRLRKTSETDQKTVTEAVRCETFEVVRKP